ncbi:MAG: cell division protein FtsH [Candidatus Nealsonbacteria bacterium CG23_combo_of_CG06-09_8_20_14_all_39_17]|uniref:ATP-dependent zinc metalloprotease FtsH n=1 Tax=Candidatus Nealsonbacteria bacterium CG23_combo_of_CG06-09_8_20_14_all_39_17 TaxID=1974722 RepID=A0A2G9YW85_9BACT|nr:MAG: cell division protein FtsH [Candidatus Nealsonbacteria bacterium CG23_combo_of_CG06-09_8_20_14_all_39_17]
MKEAKNSPIKNFIIPAIAIFLIISGIFALFSQELEKIDEISISQLAQEINKGEVKQIDISGNELKITRQNDSKATTTKEIESSLSQSLINYGVIKESFEKIKIAVEKPNETMAWIGPMLFIILPLLLFGLFFWSMIRQAKSGAMQAFDFSKAKARLFGADPNSKEKITFNDIAGLKEAKEELKEIVDFLQNPKKFLAMGARIPRGVLLLGPSGVGKTLLARAVAGEANVPFFSISGSEFVEMFVGVGASRVRDLFATAKKAGTSIIFIDELDAVGRARGTGMGGGHEEREQTLNQILVEMDGFERDDTRIVVAATNRGDVLDTALLRPGRFDRKVVLDLPDISDREEILKIHSKGKPLAEDINLKEVAERTPGFSGADLANVFNEAAILAARRNKQKIFQDELLESIEKVLLGPERRSFLISEKEKRVTAFHEAGHALVSSILPGSEPVRKISIIARGSAAGYTLKMPGSERRFKSKSEFLNDMATLLGGYCAEKLTFGEITTGASNDLEKVSMLARKLVKEYGMSSLGPVSLGRQDDLSFLGRNNYESKNYSEAVATKVDEEIMKFIKDAQEKAIKVLVKNKPLLAKISEVLMEKETIEREEFEKLIKDGNGKKVSKKIKTKVRNI